MKNSLGNLRHRYKPVSNNEREFSSRSEFSEMTLLDPITLTLSIDIADREVLKKFFSENMCDQILDAIKNMQLDMIIKLLSSKIKFDHQKIKIYDLHLCLWALGRNLDIDRFLEDNINMGLKDENNNTPLIWAAENNRIDLVNKFLTKGADINCKNSLDNTALHEAAANGYLDIVKTLLNNGAKKQVNWENYYGNTPLHLAISAYGNGRVDIAKELIANGADINKNNGGRGMYSRYTRVRANCTPMHLAVHRGDIDIFRILWNNGADRYQETDDGFTAESLAIKLGRHGIMQWIKEQTSAVNIENLQSENETLKIKVKYLEERIEKLLDQQLNINTQILQFSNAIISQPKADAARSPSPAGYKNA